MNVMDRVRRRRFFLALAGIFSSIVLSSYALKPRQVPRASAQTTAEQRDAHLTLGLDHHRNGRLDEALDEYTAAASVDPQSALAYYDIGTVQYANKNIDAAIAAYLHAVAIDRLFADAQFNLGYLQLHDRNDPAAALAPLTAAIQANPKMAKAYYERGVAYDLLGMGERAEPMWGRATTIDAG